MCRVKATAFMKAQQAAKLLAHKCNSCDKVYSIKYLKIWITYQN
jgi:uncharacterized OB-fold protein